MRVAVVGGTGTLGRLVVAELDRRGHEALSLARRAPSAAAGGHRRIDLVTGEGLQAALVGTAAVVDASNANRSRRRMRAVLLGGTQRLLRAEADAGVRHHVLISIVGIDDVGLGYYRIKLEQERLVAGAGVQASVLRATQFHQLLDRTFTVMARSGVLPAGRIPLQPVDAREVSSALVDVVEGGPGRATEQLAGPEVAPLAELARTWLAARHRHRVLLPVPVLGRVARAALAGRLTASDARRGELTFRRWLAEQVGDGSPGAHR